MAALVVLLAACCPLEEVKQVENKFPAKNFVLANSNSAKQRLLASACGVPTRRGLASFLVSKVIPVDGLKFGTWFVRLP